MIFLGVSIMCAPVMLLLQHLGVSRAWCLAWLVFCGICLVLGIINFFRKF